MVISGAQGAGKTTLVNRFLRQLPASVQALRISNPSVDSSGIMPAIGAALGITPQEDEYFDLNEFEKALEEANTEGKSIILVVDDAHLLSDHDLEVIWLFYNIERDGQKLLKILFLGTDELRQRLDTPKFKHIRASVTLNCSLSALNSQQARDYKDRPGLFASIVGYGSPWMAISLGLLILAFIGLIGFKGLLDSSSKPVPQEMQAAGKGAAAPQSISGPESGGNAPVISGIDPWEKPPDATPPDGDSRTYQIRETDKSLTTIAASRYPGQGKIAIDALILANPEIVHEDLIYFGQIIRLPHISATSDRFKLADGLFYAPYGRYYSPVSLQRDLAWLDKKQIRHLVRATRETAGRTLNRVFLGGYESEADLIAAQQGVAKKAKTKQLVSTR